MVEPAAFTGTLFYTLNVVCHFLSAGDRVDQD